MPLIDHHVVEFATLLLTALKLRDGRTKYILTECLADILPPSTVARRKQGFEMPVETWLRNELRPVLDDVFSPAAVKRRGLFDPPAMARVYAAFRRGEKPYMRVWALVTLELWARRFIDGHTARTKGG